MATRGAVGVAAAAVTAGEVVVMGRSGKAASAAGPTGVMVDKERLETADMRITWRAVIDENQIMQSSPEEFLRYAMNLHVKQDDWSRARARLHHAGGN